MKNFKWRVLVVAVVILAALWALWPTYKYYTLSPDVKKVMNPKDLTALHKKALNLGLDLQGGMYLLLEVDKSKLSEAQMKGAVDRAIEIIRNRIDQWGVFEPSIQKVGAFRILIQLPGVMNRKMARSLIGRTAQLEFHIVANGKVTDNLVQKIDNTLAREEGDTSSTVGPLLGLLESAGEGAYVVDEADVKTVDSLLSLSEVKDMLGTRYKFYWGKVRVTDDGRKVKSLFLLNTRSELTGADLKTARHTIGSPGSEIAGQAIVELTFNRKGARKFSVVTGRNVNKRLAIVLDNIVQSAPVIRQKITGGSAIIEGITNIQEAKELAVVLRAGALPAPVKIIEERSVGPLLGKDSVQEGLRALIIGFLLVVLFMIFYYNTSGLIADLALLLNLVFIFATLIAFRATLTLPGLAGIILTVGMAVDANVLIFERIREELRAGKSAKNAIDAGFHRATLTIFDANATTIIAALVLLKFGTGPIKGFGTTLTIGIIASFFTAVYVTKIIFDYVYSIKKVKNLRI